MDIIVNFSDFVQSNGVVIPTAHVNQNIAGTGNIVLAKQRRGQGQAHSLQGTVLTAGLARTHDRLATLLQNGSNIGKINIHVTVHRNNFGNALGRGGQNIVRLGKGIFKYQISKQFANLVVADDQRCIAKTTKVFQPNFGLLQSLLALKRKRQGNNTHRQNIEGSASFGQDRGCAGSGPTTQSGRYEDHFGFATNEFLEFLHGLHGSLPPDFGLIACATSFG